MYVQYQNIQSFARSFFLVTVAFALAGCGQNWLNNDGNSTLGLGALNDPNVPSFAEAGPNDLLEVAESMPASSEPRVIHGEITDTTDVDVYELGAVAPGDHIMVAASVDDSLSAAMALFDDTGAELLVNDHRNVYMGRKGPFIDVVMRRASSATYVAISATPGFDGTGNYSLVITKEANAQIPQSHPDTVLLVFSGAKQARIGTRNPVDVPTFNAASISDKYAGQTEEMISHIVSRVRTDYAGFDVEILSTSEGARFEDSMSRVFFGTYDPDLLGVAEGIDEFNASDAQEAIVFTDTFEAFMPLDPTVEEMAQALANVASHEAGHLLGLVHTSDPQGIMDVTASLSQLMDDQFFTQSPLYGDVFPLGYENEVQSLLDSVGEQPGTALLAERLAMPKISHDNERSRSLPARSILPLSSCSLHHNH